MAISTQVFFPSAPTWGADQVGDWLVLKGGPIGPEGEAVVGPHLSLLGQYFMGYQVTFVGSLIGFGYAFVSGFVGGYSVAYLYNWMVILRGHDTSGGRVD